MADLDIPDSGYNRGNLSAPDGLHPTIAELKSALTTFNATSYSPARMFSMTKNDLMAAVRLHNLGGSVPGLG